MMIQINEIELILRIFIFIYFFMTKTYTYSYFSFEYIPFWRFKIKFDFNCEDVVIESINFLI